MNKKVTLTLDEELLERAKEYAERNGYSLSEVIENYLKRIIEQKAQINANIELTPIVKSLKGSFQAPGIEDDKKELSDRLSEKYL